MIPENCQLPRIVGPCTDYQVRYYYDEPDSMCKPFSYSGCEGNVNNFQSLATCQDQCYDFHWNSNSLQGLALSLFFLID